MIGLLQRVTEASVSVDGVIARIERGLLVLVGVQRVDDARRAGRLLDRLIHYRVFPDQTGRLNLSLKDIDGGLLLVPQFTLTADTRKGRRPGLSGGAAPERGRALLKEALNESILDSSRPLVPDAALPPRRLVPDAALPPASL